MWINWNDLPESMKNEQVTTLLQDIKKETGELDCKAWV